MRFEDIRVAKDMEFKDISGEEYRTYYYADTRLDFENPIAINVSKSGGHKLILGDGRSVYVRDGWLAFEWKVADPKRLQWKF